jgi:hypothetical protein
VSGGYVYWGNNLGGAIWRAPSDGSASPSLVSTAVTPRDLALHANDVYWIDESSNVWSAPQAGGMAAIAATPTNYMGTPATAGEVLELIDSPVGPIVSIYVSPGYIVSNVLSGLVYFTVNGLGNSDGSIAQDGTDVFLGELAGTCGAVSLSSATSDGWSAPVRGCGGLLAATGCGVLLSSATLMPRGESFGVSLLSAGIDRAIVVGGFVYFHSTTDNAIGRLPLP